MIRNQSGAAMFPLTQRGTWVRGVNKHYEVRGLPKAPHPRDSFSNRLISRSRFNRDNFLIQKMPLS